MGPVKHGGDPRVQRLDDPQQVGGVEVLGPVILAQHAADCLEVGGQGPVNTSPSGQRLPGVPVGVDEAGKHDHALGLDHLRTVCRKLAPNRGDLAVLHQDVPTRELAQLLVQS